MAAPSRRGQPTSTAAFSNSTAASSLPPTLNSGSIGGGSITTSGAGQLHLTSSNNNILDGVTLVGGLLLDASNGRVRFRNDTTFTSYNATLTGNTAILSFEGTATDSTATLANSTINLDGPNGYVSLDGTAPVLTIAGTGVIRGRGNVSRGQIISVTGSSQLLNQGLVSADLAGQSLTLTPHVINNLGTFSAVNGATLAVSSPSFTNSPGGILSATGGSTLALQQIWHNQGSLVLQDTSTLSLEGTFTTADLGLSGWSRMGGTVKLLGTLDNTGSTLDLTAAIGGFVFNGGIIKGGIVNETASGKLTFASNNLSALDGAFVNGGITLDQSNGRVRLRNDASFSGATLTGNSAVLSFEGTAGDSTATLASTINLDGPNGYVSLDSTAPVVTVAPSGVMRGRGSITYAQIISVTGTEQLVNQGLVSADITGQGLTVSPRLITNSGTFSAVNGATLTVNSASFTNVTGGILSATGGSTLALQQGWHNQGSLILQDTSVLSLEGAFTTADLGLAGWSRTGGTVNLVGTLDNTGATLDLAATGPVLFKGGSLKGGVVNQSGSAKLFFPSNNQNILDGVTVNGGLTLDQSNGRLRLRNDATFTGAAAVTGNSAVLSFEGTATDQTATFAATINLDGLGGYVSLDSSAPVLTIAPSGVIRGRGSLASSQIVSVNGTEQLFNQGLVSADITGQSLIVSPHLITNTGTFSALNGGILTVNSASFTNLSAGVLSATGGSTLALQQGWRNQGSLILQDTSTLSLEGAFSTADLGLAGWSRTGGTVKLVGTLDNSSATLDLTAAIGGFLFNGGTIKGGAVNESASGKLTFSSNNANALDGAFVNGGVTLDQSNGRVRLRNDAAFTVAALAGNSAVLSFEGTATDHTAILAATVNMDGLNGYVSLDGSAPVLTIAPSGVIRGRGSLTHSQIISVAGAEQIVNQGLVSADIAGQGLTVSPRFITNSGAFSSLNGGILTVNSASFTNLSGGVLSATGGSTLALQQGWHNGGSLILQDTSVLSLEGAFTTADLGLSGWSRTGGTVKLVGSLDNSAATLDLASAGSIVFNGGTIKGGTVNQSAVSKLVFLSHNANALEGALVTGDLVLDQSNGRVRLRNDTSFSGATLTGNSAVLAFEGTALDHTATFAGTINLDGPSGYVSLDGNAPVLTIAPSGVVRGRGSFTQAQIVSVTGSAQLINQGLISADLSAQTLSLSSFSLVNTGIIEAKNGATLNLTPALATQAAGTFRLSGGYLQVNAGVAGPDMTVGPSARLEGYGEVRFNNAATDSLSLAGTLDPSSGAGGLAIKGDLVPTASAILAFDLAGATQGTGYDFVAEGGSSALNLAGSTLKVTLRQGFTPANAQLFVVLASNQALTGSFGNVASGARLATSEGYGTFLVTYAGGSVVLSDFQATPQAAFLAFMDSFFPGVTDPAIVGDSADPDGDGVPNLLEFALKGNPASGLNKGLACNGLQDVNPAPGNEFCLTIPCRTGASFSAQPDGSQKNVTAMDSVHYTAQGGGVIGVWNSAVLHSGPSFTAPAGFNLPDLTGSGWEYHTFYLDPALVSGPGRFLRVAVDNAP